MVHSFRNEIIELGAQHAVVISIGLLVFLVDKFEGLSDSTNYTITISWAVFKSIYFIFHNFRSITKIVGNERSFNHFIALVSVNIVLIITSFAVDYFVLYKIYPQGFKGVLASDDLSVLSEMLYFSLITFTTTGFGDIVPTANFARLPVSMEIIVGFVSTIFIISNFSNFKNND